MALSARIRANKIHLASYIGKGIIPGAGGGGSLVRAFGNGLGATLATSPAGGTVWSLMTRASAQLKGAIKRSRVHFSMYYYAASGVTETDWPASLKIMCSLEPNFDEKLTGIAPRTITYKAGASKTLLYNGPGTLPTRDLVSDWLDHATPIQAGKLGIWTTVENQLGAASPANTLPTSGTTSRYVNRNEGVRSNSAQDVGVSYIDTLATETKDVVTALAAGRAGTLQGFWPSFMEVEYVSGAIDCIAIIGDSMAEGTGTGAPGPGGDAPDVPGNPIIVGDALGDLNRNRGYAAVGVDQAGLGYVNFGKGGDGFKFMSVDGNMTARLAGLVASGAKTIIMEPVFNDTSSVDATFIAQVTKVYDLIEAAVPNIKIVQCTAVPYAISTRPVTNLVYNNTANLATVTVATTADLQQGQTVKINGSSVTGLNIRAVINITSGTTFTYSPPAALGADQTPTGTINYDNEFRSLIGQSHAFSHYNPTQLTNSRSSKNQMIRSKSGPFARCFAIYDPNLVCEAGYTGTAASETNQWKVEAGVSFPYTWDGAHQNNAGQIKLGTDMRQKGQAGGWL